MRHKPKFWARTKTGAGRIGQPASKSRPTLLVLLGHFAMGVAIGLAFALVLATDQRFGIRELIMRSATPEASLLVLLGSFGAMFGIGATLTGFALIMMDQE